MSYEVYARKYRPMMFDQVIGQQHVVQTLQNAIKNNRVAHGYIFSGMRGIGKTTVARIFAKALNCKEGPTPDPCNKCDSCTEVNEDRSMDVLEIDGASNRGIDEVRSLRDGVKYKPIHGKNKVIIIDEVHMLTREAFNALLKTLEEPPPNTVFILATTEFHKLPHTIISRCQHFEFKKITQKDIINHLLSVTQKEKITISSAGLNLIAEAADGSLRDAQSLLDQAVAFSGDNISDEDLKDLLGVINKELLFAFSRAIIGEKPDQLFTLVEDIIDRGYDLRFFYRELIHHFRNILVIKNMKDPSDVLVLSEDDLVKLKKEAEDVTSDELLRYLLALQQADQGLKFSSHPRIFLESVLIKLCLFKKIVPLKDLIKLIEKSEIQVPPRATPSEKFEREIPSVREEAGRRSPPSPKPSSSETSNQNVPTARKKNKELEKALEDPSVKSFMDSFKAQVLSVEQIKKGKK